MVQRTIKYALVLACAVLALAAAGAAADDKDKPGLSGVWVKKDGELKIEFSDKDTMKIFPHGENEAVIIICKYGIEKEGLVKAKITELEGKQKEKAKDVAPVGFKFSFRWRVKDDAATLGETTGDNIEVLKSHLEGEFARKN